ncbi:MAG: VOC family protein [Proteobacteria bacterium]|nr:VOC family protein [Pseudomonadota bacterium]
MQHSINLVALVVRDYDEAIDFYTRVLGFELTEDAYQEAQDKRWVVVTPAGGSGVSLLLAQASTPEQKQAVGNQAGGRMFLFLSTDDFWRDYRQLQSHKVRFLEDPRDELYGTVVVFEDLYGNRWDLIQPRD